MMKESVFETVMVMDRGEKWMLCFSGFYFATHVWLCLA
jgi:hypothetical protein